MAETVHHVPPVTVFDEPPDEVKDPPPDWKVIDRLIILFSLTIARGVLKKRLLRWDVEIKDRVLDRMAELIEEYKRPKKTRKPKENPETW